VASFLETAASYNSLGRSGTAAQHVNFAHLLMDWRCNCSAIGRNFLFRNKSDRAGGSGNVAQQMNEYLSMELPLSDSIHSDRPGCLTVAIFYGGQNFRISWKRLIINIRIDLERKNLVLGVMLVLRWRSGVCYSLFVFTTLQGWKRELPSLFIALLGFMVGRFVGTFLLNYISALVCASSLANIVLLITVLLDGMFSIYTLIGVEFLCHYVPTIFSPALPDWVPGKRRRHLLSCPLLVEQSFR
jgi:FHS family L-fucose permease-like MFS transporter